MKNLTKTPFRQELEARNLLIYTKRNQLRAVEGSKKTLIDKMLMKEFHMHTTNAINVICKEVEKRLAEEKTV